MALPYRFGTKVIPDSQFQPQVGADLDYLVNPGSYTVSYQGNGGGYNALDHSGTSHTILALGANALADNITRVGSGGGGVSLDDSSGNVMLGVAETGTVYIPYNSNTLSNLASQSHLPSKVLITDGTNAAPVTAGDKPTVQISRIESIVDGTSAGDGSGGSTFCVNAQTDNSQQLNAFKAVATTNPNGSGNTNDNVAVYGVAEMNGNANQGHIGYAGFFVADTTTVGNGAVAVGTGLFNNTGVDQIWGSGVQSTTLDLVAQGNNNLLSSAAMLRAANGAQFDVGIGITTSSIKSAVIVAPLLTPATSTAAGYEGSIKWDADFIYVCTAPNVWKRATLNSF